MKKILFCLLTVLLALSAAACDFGGDPAAGGGNPWLLPVVLIVLVALYVAWMFFSRKKKAQQVAETDSKFVVGATVITVGGVLGTIVEINEKDNTFTIEMLPDGVKMTVVRGGLYGIKPDAKEEEPVVDYDEAVVSSDDVGHESAVSCDDEIK